jgi:hypothetical protein
VFSLVSFKYFEIIRDLQLKNSKLTNENTNYKDKSLILISEQDILRDDYELLNKNNEENKQIIKNYESIIEKEREANEKRLTNNHELKQNEIILCEKLNKITMENNNLLIKVDESQNKNNQLIYDIQAIAKNLSEKEKEL